MNPIWTSLHPKFKLEYLGLVPQFLDTRDGRSAVYQFDDKYISGWHPMKGFKLVNEEPLTIQYPGDSPMSALATAQLREENIYFFPGSWVMVRQADGSFEISRMD